MSPTLRVRRLHLLLLALAVCVSDWDAARASTLPVQNEPAARRAATDHPRANPAHPERVIVKFKPTTSPSARADLRRQERLEKVRELGLIRAEVARVTGRSPEDAVRSLNRRAGVEYASLDYVRRPSGYADEPRFGEQWGHENVGQTIDGITGTPDVDTNAPQAAAVSTGGSGTLVAVIDDGVDFGHPDLAGRQWVNPGESGTDSLGGNKATNRLDDDGNGYVDDVNGWDFCNNDNTVFHAADGDAHGTHVAGVIAASVNGTGIAGMAPNAELMALKFICRGAGYDSDAIRAIEYARNKGVRISNNSWGSNWYNPALEEAVAGSGMLFVAAAGNRGVDNIEFPARLSYPHVIAVSAINNEGRMPSWSNYSRTQAHISAPGAAVLSAVPYIPQRSALTLSSFGTGKAVVSGFGVEEIRSRTNRESFLRHAFSAIGRGNEPVALVADHVNTVSTTWVTELQSEIAAVTGTATEVIWTGEGYGPDLSELQGKVIVWATALAYSSDTSGFSTTLMPQDQSTLTAFLEGGGKLVLSGRDALLRIEESDFVTRVLGLEARSDIGFRGADAMVGAADTGFVGESYDLGYNGDSNPLAYPPFHDELFPMAGSSAISLGFYPSKPATYEYWDGTSMAAPYVAGAAAVVGTAQPSLLDSPWHLRTVLLNSSKPAPYTVGKTITGRMVDAHGALAALGETVRPAGSVKLPGGTTAVNTRSVYLEARSRDPLPGSGTVAMRFRSEGGAWSAWERYGDWDAVLDVGQATVPSGDGGKTVYGQYRDAAGNYSLLISTTFLLDTVNPIVTTPSARLVTGTKLGADGSLRHDLVPVRLAWSGSDGASGSGIARYFLGRFEGTVDYDNYTNVSLSSRTSRSVTDYVRPAKPHEYRLWAADKAGNRSATVAQPRFTIYQHQETSAAVTYPAGAWRIASDVPYSGFSTRYATGRATARFNFSGRQVAWVSTRGPDRGKAEVWLDGSRVATVDLYAPTLQVRKLVYTRAVNASVSHKLEVRVLGAKNANSTGYRVDVDAFLVMR